MCETVRLGDVLELQNGYAFKSKEYSQAGHFLIRITNVQQGYLSLHNPKYVAVDKQSGLEKFALKERDIVISLTGDVGRVAVVMPEHLPAALNQRVAKVNHIDNEKLDNSYLFYFLNSKLFRDGAESFARGAAQLNISTKDILTTSIPLPPLAEQKRIVERLDKAFAEIDKAIATAEAKEGEIRRLNKKVLDETFENIEKPLVYLGDCCEFVRGPFGGSLKKSSFVEEGFAVYEQQHAIGNQCEKFRYYITPEKFQTMQRFEVKKGDILMSCSGTIGKTTIISGDSPRGVINQALLKITPSESVVGEYIDHYMKSDVFSDQLRNHIDGAAIKNVASVKLLKKIGIKLPSVGEQMDLVAKLDRANNYLVAALDAMERKKSNYVALKAAILKQELTPSEAV